MSNYDMVAEPDEPYYASQYLHWILPELSGRFPDKTVRILDLGCGQGRLSLPLAEWCSPGKGLVIGVDFTPAAVEGARKYAGARNLTNVLFETQNVLDFINGEPDNSADAILLIEAVFVLPKYREIIRQVQRVLRPNGVFLVSFRSQYFNVLHTIRNRNWAGAGMAIDLREGHIFGPPATFTWHTVSDIRAILSDAGFTIARICGIGIGSGIEGDPLSHIARPSQLSAPELRQLMDIETRLAEEYASCGRYILSVAVKPLENK